MMRRTPNGVTLEVTEDQFGRLLMALGYAIGAASDGDKELLYSWMRLANEINEGNPHYTPYAIPPEFETAPDTKENPR